MPSKSGNHSSPPAAGDAPPSRADLMRRRFLVTLGVAGAGAGVVAAGSIPTGPDVAQAPEPVSADGRYAATAHVQTYYKTAKL